MADDHPQRVTPQRRWSHLRGAASRLVQDAPVAETHEGNREIRPEAHDRRSVERAQRNADRGRDDRGRKSPAARSQRLPRQGPGPHERQGPIQRSRGPGASRRLRLGYRAYTLDDAYAAIATIDLRVRAPVTLTVAPRAAHNGTRIVFRGRLRAGPGRRGTIVTIYALSLKGRKRIPVDSVKADRRGHFHLGYRFTQIARSITYRFQARVTHQSSYPYATGWSRTVRVAARP